MMLGKGGSKMKLPRRQFLYLAASAAALPAVSRITRAQSYPSRPVKIIVGQAAGSASDLIARLIAQFLSEKLGQQFLVEVVPGPWGIEVLGSRYFDRPKLVGCGRSLVRRL